MSIQVVFTKFSKTYGLGEKVTGRVIVSNAEGSYYNGIHIKAEGQMVYGKKKKYSASGKNPNSEIYNMVLLRKEKKIAEPGHFKEDEEFFFEFKIGPNEGMQLLESYKGVYIVVDYELQVDIPRSGLSKSLKHKEKFYINLAGFGFDKVWGKAERLVEFKLSDKNLEASGLQKIPKFEIEGVLNNVNCCIDEPFYGYIQLNESELEVHSIEIQLVRVESYQGVAGSVPVKEGTEVQNIQIADGNVIKGIQIPIFMIFPRYFSSASFEFKGVSVGFEINILAIFKAGYEIVENFQLRLYRKNFQLNILTLLNMYSYDVDVSFPQQIIGQINLSKLVNQLFKYINMYI